MITRMRPGAPPPRFSLSYALAGRTALHALAEAASTSERNTCWDGKALSVSQAWVSMAALVLKLGCDPRLPDRHSHHPDQLARAAGNHILAEELAKVGTL